MTDRTEYALLIALACTLVVAVWATLATVTTWPDRDTRHTTIPVAALTNTAWITLAFTMAGAFQ